MTLSRPVPVLVAFAGPQKQNRFTVFFRIILLIPQLFVLFFVGIAAFVVVVIGWFAALVMGRLPRFAAEIPDRSRALADPVRRLRLLDDRSLSAVHDRTGREVSGLADGPARSSQPVGRVLPTDPRHPGQHRVLRRLLRCLHHRGRHHVFIVLINGRMPQSLYEAYAAILRYQARLGGYVVMLTSEWPWGLFGDTEMLDTSASLRGLRGLRRPPTLRRTPRLRCTPGLRCPARLRCTPGLRCPAAVWRTPGLRCPAAVWRTPGLRAPAPQPTTPVPAPASVPPPAPVLPPARCCPVWPSHSGGRTICGGIPTTARTVASGPPPT